MANILVVDDNESDRLLERTILQEAGHTLFFAGDGEGALKVFGEHAVDVVVTDLHMPKLNGLRLIQELIALDPDAAVVAISGVAADQLLLAEDLGAVQTLFKPVDPDRLVAAVESALETRQANLWGRGKRS